MEAHPQAGQVAMNIVICDDHRLFTEVFAALLERRGHRVITEASTPVLALKAVERGDVDVCVMDLNFPSANGLDAVAAISESENQTKVVILTGYSDPFLRDEALAAGASACLSKDLDAETVIDLIEAINAGVDVPSGDDVQIEVGLSTDTGEAATQWVAQFLTERERQALIGLAYGESTNELAARLGVRPSTARTHIENLLSKLGVHSRVAAVTFALEHSLIDFPSADNSTRDRGP